MPSGHKASIFAVLAIALASAMPAGAAELFQYVPASKSSRVPATVQNPLAVQMDAASLASAQPGSSFDVTLPDGAKATIHITALEHHDNGDVSWHGTVADLVRGDLVAHGTTGAAGTYAQIETRNGTWGIVPAGAGHDWLFDQTAAEKALPAPRLLDDARVPTDVAPEARPKTTCPTTATMPTPQVTIDVLVVMAPDFVSTAGGAAGAETRLNSIFSNINAYNTASNVAIKYRRVATLNADYQAANAANDDDGDALTAVTNGTGSFANIAAIRNFYGADMVALFRGPKNTQGTEISGIAWVNGDTNGNIAAASVKNMYSVHGDWTFPGATLPAHELGHNLGNNHDHPNAPGTGSGATTYSYGYYVCGSGASASCGQAGFNDTGTGFGTIMAYQQPVVAKFASPNLTCQSTRAGALASACGVANQEDDVRSMNCVRQTVAAMKSSWVGNCANLTADADNDGIPDCLEAGSGTVNGIRDNDIFGNGLLFVAQQYRDFLAREADADGLNFWTTQVASGAKSRTDMVQAYLESAEFQGQIAPIARLYFAYYLRIPDYGGLQYWIGQYKAGNSLDSISQQFAASPEFAQRYGSLTNNQFVSLVYQNVLGRAPDAAGLAHWVGQLDSGAANRGQVMTQFSESAEYANLINHKVYVTMTYMGMLRRAPDQGGFDFWVSYMNNGNSPAALVSSFVTSPEYHARFLP